MKRIFILLFVFAMFSFFACEKRASSYSPKDFVAQLFGTENVLTDTDGTVWIRRKSGIPRNGLAVTEFTDLVVPWQPLNINANLDSSIEIRVVEQSMNNAEMQFELHNKGVSSVETLQYQILVELEGKYYPIPMDTIHEIIAFQDCSDERLSISILSGINHDVSLPNGHYIFAVFWRASYNWIKFSIHT